MTTALQWMILVLVGGLIGWMTNRLAIRLLFRPQEPFVIPVLGWTLQGLIPRRKSELARAVGTQVEQELLSMRDILLAFQGEEKRQELKLFLRLYFNDRILERIPGFLRKVMKKPVDHFVTDLMNRESDQLLEEILDYLAEEGMAGIEVATIVEERINAFPMARLERMVLSVAGRELTHIEWIGGLLGMCIGLVQGFLLLVW